MKNLEPDCIKVGGLVALASLLVIGTSECGAYLDFKMSPLPTVQLKREACPPK
ncbi:hypothetical protein [Nodularia sp. UHCC 0506]|uniref:hypothetical protein n=1 Tax=Nodularia sp. UHCC 0506 TaxID=3110243 RepID=UPI002B2039D8|nr:hypothetical protein [Nodularia sp. UHCC 0506]MEA5516765.1 hypothetical protein [Nodularia sp. UHCC 0506]